MMLRPSPVRSDRFRYDPASRTFSACLSDLGFKAGEYPFGRVYDDAADEGLTIVSAMSGKEIVFHVAEYDRDNDYQFGVRVWTLHPSPGRQLRANPVPPNLKVVIFND